MCTSEAQCTPRYIPYISSPRRQIDFSILSGSPTSPVLSTSKRNRANTSFNTTSPVLRSSKKEQCSPVLNTSKRKSSPVISNKELIKIRKQRILESNRKSNCVRKLQYEHNNSPEMIEHNIGNKKFTLHFNSEHIKEQNKVFNDYNYKKRKRKRSYNYRIPKRIKTFDEKIEIESVCSQDIADKIENSIIEKLESPRNVLQKTKHENIEVIYSQEVVNETSEIELVNSQEIMKFQPQAKIEEMSQNSYTPNEKIIIEDINSQSSSPLSNISNCTVVQDSFEKSSEEYIWSPIKKKKYKPGTYSHKFQRILRKQKGNTAIWKHELYLAKSTNYEIPVSEDDSKITIVQIRKMNTDYGMDVLECVEVESNEKCLVIADLSQLFDDVVLRRKDLIKIHPPFIVDYLKIDDCDIKTFVNVHKILKCT